MRLICSIANLAADVASKKVDSSCAKLIVERLIPHAEKNVRRLTCDSGSGNAYFRTKRVFVTNSHAFTDKWFNKWHENMLKSCWAPRMEYGRVQGRNAKMVKEDNIETSSIKLGQDRELNDVGGDFAVAGQCRPTKARRHLELFAVNIRNQHTRRSYDAGDAAYFPQMRRTPLLLTRLWLNLNVGCVAMLKIDGNAGSDPERLCVNFFGQRSCVRVVSHVCGNCGGRVGQ